MAGFYDPNRNGQGQGGWWHYGTGSDTFPVYGPPGVPGNEANAIWEGTNFSEFLVPVGSYEPQSPWGLFDVAGGVTELTEGVSPIGYPRFRWAVGSSAGDAGGVDFLGSVLTVFPGSAGYGLRIASAVPSPSAAMLFVVAGWFRSRTHRRPR